VIFIQQHGLHYMRLGFDKPSWTSLDLDQLCEAIFLSTQWFADAELCKAQEYADLREHPLTYLPGIASKICDMLPLVTPAIQATGVRMVKCMNHLVSVYPSVAISVITKLNSLVKRLYTEDERINSEWLTIVVSSALKVCNVLARSKHSLDLATETGLCSGVVAIRLGLPVSALHIVFRVLTEAYVQDSEFHQLAEEFFILLISSQIETPGINSDGELSTFIPHFWNLVGNQKLVDPVRRIFAEFSQKISSLDFPRPESLIVYLTIFKQAGVVLEEANFPGLKFLVEHVEQLENPEIKEIFKEIVEKK